MPCVAELALIGGQVLLDIVIPLQHGNLLDGNSLGGIAALLGWASQASVNNALV